MHLESYNKGTGISWDAYVIKYVLRKTENFLYFLLESIVVPGG